MPGPKQLDFMLIGLPRSGTTWLANLLCTPDTLCIHDPLYQAHYSDFDTVFYKKYPGYKTYGISCTGIWRWPEWVNNHPSVKVILHSDFNTIQNSLDQLGLPVLENGAAEALYNLNGIHLQAGDIFTDIKVMQELWNAVTPEPFKDSRYNLLLDLHIQPNFEKILIDKEATTRLYRELSSCVQC